MEPSKLGDAEDLATLAKLDEKVLLEELKERYSKDKIYTYVGDILVAVNPYRDIGVYGRDVSEIYKLSKRNEHPPHIFAVADTAYQDMMGLRGRVARNQCILISGESGAGKTESTKLIINQLINISKGNTQLEQQIIQVNPLLEAFGNAQTLMNDNSSRFGRFIQLKFKAGSVIGSKISEYLLEKSRVVQQNEGEENFHIFYYLFAGLTPEEQNKYRLKDPYKYRYFSDGASCLKKSPGALKERHDELVNAMDMVGFTDEEQEDMVTVLSAVLNTGNIDVQSNEDNEAVIQSGPGSPIRTVADLMGLNYSDIHAVFTSSRTVTKGDEVKRIYTQAQAIEARNAVSKAMYGRLFSWIINKINTLLAASEQHSLKDLREIGILDIFGFEHFDHNSFEQACINLANEQLQFFFNKHVFTLEQEEYKKEGIDWKEIKFVDNQPLLDLFQGKPIGILSLLDEECQIPRGSELAFVEKMNMKFDHDLHYTKSPHAKTGTFTIHHYAGKVIYNAEGWLDKNRDTMPPGVMQLLQVSENRLLSLIFKGKISRTGTLALKGGLSKRTTKRVAQRAAKEAKERKLTVGAQFRNSLQVLMERMTASQPVFIRCIKPNEKKKPNIFDDKHVNAQLLYTGMLETTKIRREGYAVRPSFADFTEKYCFLAYQATMDATSENCSKILQCSKITGWQMGKTKVFLKYYHIDALVERLEELGKKVVHIQRLVRGFLGRRKAARALAVAEHERNKMFAFLKQISDMQLTLDSKMAMMKENDANIPKDYFQRKQNGAVEKAKDHEKVAGKESVESYMVPISRTTTTETGTDALCVSDSSESDDVQEDDFTPVKSGGANRFGPQGTKQASVRWFKETQMQTVKDPVQDKFADWFHGIITRREAERLLTKSGIGCFLIRVSESRFGYTLSFRAEDKIRHYMIDQLPNGKYIVIGEPKVHKSLHDLVGHHQKIRLSNWPRVLKQPCGQETGQCNYSDLLDDNSVYEDELMRSDNAPVYFEPDATTPLHVRNSRNNETHFGYSCIPPDDGNGLTAKWKAPPKPARVTSNQAPPPVPSRASRPDLVLVNEVKVKSRQTTTRSDIPPPLPDRMYSLQRPVDRNSKPIPVPPEVYDKLLENQANQNHSMHSHDSSPGARKSRMSTSRHQLPRK